MQRPKRFTSRNRFPSFSRSFPRTSCVEMHKRSEFWLQPLDAR
jgi:hypothetical protein